MFKKRDVVVFLAGAAALHTLSHLLISFTHILPLELYGIVWTQQLNLWTIVISGLITVALLYWAANLKK
ncbi:hypothetical protein M1446_05495 [Candidatus Dependentiae bacterium]|nr:hypothetical protein [Candidatus Dependentiae bacterium]